MNRLTFCSLFVAALFAVASPGATETDKRIFESNLHTFKVEVLSDKLKYPWGLAFLPDGSMLITEQDGTLRRFKDGKLSPVLRGVPIVKTGGQAGLLDIVADPQFKQNNYIYMTLTKPGRGTGISVVRATYSRSGLRDAKVIFEQNNSYSSPYHYGSRMVFAPDGMLFVTVGDRFVANSAQNPMDHAGSILRINKDGSIPVDNPFADGKKAMPEIWSIGHRNPQGVDIHPGSGDVWTVAHGPTGGDEINKPEAGKNYGWPIISYGLSMSGGRVGVGTHKEGMEQPRYYWDPSIAPSSMTFYTGSLFPGWKGDIFVSALRGQLISRLDIEGDHILGEERLLEDEYGRIRNVKTGPDGALYALTDNGELLRISPAD